jgi:hypothetical protein
VDIVNNAREREENKRFFEEKYLKVNALRINKTDSKKEKLGIVSFLPTVMDEPNCKYAYKARCNLKKITDFNMNSCGL